MYNYNGVEATGTPQDFQWASPASKGLVPEFQESYLLKLLGRKHKKKWDHFINSLPSTKTRLDCCVLRQEVTKRHGSIRKIHYMWRLAWPFFSSPIFLWLTNLLRLKRKNRDEAMRAPHIKTTWCVPYSPNLQHSVFSIKSCSVWLRCSKWNLTWGSGCISLQLAVQVTKGFWTAKMSKLWGKSWSWRGDLSGL